MVPCLSAYLDILDLTATQLSQKAQPEHLVGGGGGSDNVGVRSLLT